MAKLALVLLAVLVTASCRFPESPASTPLGAGVMVGSNSLTGAIVRFEDGDVTCYASSTGGVSCVAVCR